MRTNKILVTFLVCSLMMICGCEDNDAGDPSANPSTARLKRVLLYSSKDSDQPLNVVEEYEYDQDGRIMKVSAPYTSGLLQYRLYEYNANGQLSFIANYNANSSSPTGFINIKNYFYDYDVSGNKQKELIEYPQIGSSEYTLFVYENKRLVRSEKYNNRGALETYSNFLYNDQGEVVKETSYSSNDEPFSISEHRYSNGLHTQTHVYAGSQTQPVREIDKTYDRNGNLVMLESKELKLYSSLQSHVLRYEYD